MFVTHQRFAELSARATDQRNGQTAAPGNRVRQGQRVQPAIGRRLRNNRIAGQGLHQNGMHQDRHRIIPRRNVGNQPDGFTRAEQAVDVLDIPLDAADAPVDIGERLGVRLADFPDQEQRDQFTLFAETCQTIRDTLLALVETYFGPLVRFGLREAHRAQRRLQIDHGNPAEAAAIDGGGIVAAEPRILPFPFH